MPDGAVDRCPACDARVGAAAGAASVSPSGQLTCRDCSAQLGFLEVGGHRVLMPIERFNALKGEYAELFRHPPASLPSRQARDGGPASPRLADDVDRARRGYLIESLGESPVEVGVMLEGLFSVLGLALDGWWDS